VNINGKPALRVGDKGTHAACCGSNTWKAVKGAPRVLINGRAVHRIADKTQHCGGSGRLIEGSPDVIVGDYMKGDHETLRPILEIRLYDQFARPLPFAPCVWTAPGREPRAERAQPDALITIRDLEVPTRVHVKWSRPKPGDGPSSPPPKLTDEFEFALDVAFELPENTSMTASLLRLTNMGYVRGPTTTDDIREFQRDYKTRFPDLVIDGKLNAATQRAIKDAHDACHLIVKCQLTLGGEPS
jgi:hypothetical protein